MHAVLRSRVGGALPRITRPLTRAGSTFPNGIPPPQHTIAKPAPGTEYVPPKEESMGAVFYGCVAAAIATGLFVKLESSSHPDDEASLTQKIRKWHASYNQDWDERNNFHAKLIEKAAEDKALFYDTRPVKTIPLRNAETFNSFAPWNQESGWTQGNLEEVKAHYWAAHADRKNGSF